MGAVVGAALGAGMPFDQVRRRAMGIRRKDVAPFNPLVLLMGLFARSLFPASALRRAIVAGATPVAIWRSWDAKLARFRRARLKYLLY